MGRKEENMIEMGSKHGRGRKWEVEGYGELGDNIRKRESASRMEVTD